MSTVGRALIFLVGAADTLAGAALLLVPEWFFETAGQFPPFNRHYAGDAGSFLLPIGVGLMAASRALRERHILPEPRYDQQTWEQFLAERFPRTVPA